ncbi:MAG TPA: hypothetical protein VJ875_20225 [Pyrinomonadaceae bacterium]|nr:hypothetical protein [Pyrinomonadaceae bacterium]
MLVTQRRKGARFSRVPLRLCAFACVCFSLLWTSVAAQKTPARFGPPSTLAIIKNQSITESSGLVASRTTPGAYWTHNDSGDGPFVYALDTRGDSLGVFHITGAQAVDWEDIAIGPGPLPNKSYLYIGDIGDNDEIRSEVVVYRVAEPVLSAANRNSTTKHPITTEPAEAIRLRYPDGKHDAEALLVHPTTGNIYIVSKVMIASPVVYEAAAPLNAGKPITMRRIGEIRIPSLFGGMITGGSVSPDGRRVALCDYFQGYELVLPRGAANFDEIWKQKMIGFDLGKRKQGEAITYRLDGKALLATSEGKQPPLIQVEIH